MKLKLILLLALTAIFHSTTAQPPEIIYQGSVAKSGYDNNVSYGPFNIGFGFNFFGNTYDQFFVTSNGLVMFGAGSNLYSEVPIPTADVPNNFIAAFWDDLIIDPSGNILYKTIGAAPNRKLIIQFRNMGFYPFPVYMGTFAVILYESTNIIQVQYRLIILKDLERAHGGSATIGIENADGSAGVQYAYHSPDAVSTGKAVSFTPAGTGYTMNTDAMYDGVLLTTDITLPEPGTIALIVPAENSIIGTNQKFEWAPSTDAASYSLKISNSPDLGVPVSYDAGSNLSYNLTGLTPDTDYYWAVFASNPTGFTWCEVDKFTTSSTPPLTAIPETKWIEKGEELIIGLKYSGGDASAKSAIITSLPAQGQLYQYDVGVKGDPLSSVPANVSDTEMRVIYTASGNTGNGAGSFNFKIHDNSGDSPQVTFAINVSPPGVPNLLNVARSTGIEIEFDRPMSDPSGKQSQFAVTVNGSLHTIASCSLKPGDPYTILLTMAIPIAPADAVLVEYTRGDVTAITGGFLESFYNMPVTLLAQTITFNEVPSKTYGDTPFTLSSSASSHLGMTYSSSDLTLAEILSNTVTIRSAGTILITARQAGNAVYAPAKYIRQLTINKADLVFTADNKTRRYLESNPEFTYTISGFVYGENQSVIDILPTAGTTATESSSAGQYPISFSGGTDNDYNFVFVDGILTITKIPQTISFNAIPKKLLVTESFMLAAQSTSGLPVLFESLTPAFATVSGNELTGVSKGAAQIRAYNDGNENYEGADTVATVEIYSTHRDILNLFTPNNDGFNDLWEIPQLATYGKSDVRIYNRWGKLVFSSPDYNNTWNGTSNGKDLPEGAYYFIIKTQNSGTITGTVNIVR